MLKETKRDQLLRAGHEYEAILEALRKHQQDYRRLVLDIGVREQAANGSKERVISLPEMPGLAEQEQRVADRLLAHAAELAYRPGRVTPVVARDDIAGLVPLKNRSVQFSPERLAQELANEILGERGLARARHQAAKHLKRYFGPHLNVGAAFCISGVAVTRNEKGRMIDPINSLRLADWLTNFAMVLEAAGLNTLLARAEELIEGIDCVSRATIEAQHLLEDGEHVIRLSLRKDLLRVYLSGSLLEKLQDFIDTHEAPLNPDTDSTWFRSAGI